ncbi:hypothetical protein AB0H76_01485 [Nocardia sp. NPDC050712]|uniref:hypothetical protein n=1 Tax=Nocardia sp. NPDC050712 TaxID=3155518 RepID=UPI0033E0E5EF
MWEGWEEEQRARRRRFRNREAYDAYEAYDDPGPDRAYDNRAYDNRGYDTDRRADGQTDWAGAAIIFVLLLVGAIVLLVLVSTADFGGDPETTVPRTPGPCAPFCTGPQSGP